jgi:putative membrane protein
MMFDGFLGTRASFMLDFVFLAMFLVIPLLGVSVWLVKNRRNYLWHKRMQLLLGVVLLLAVVAFEADIRISEYQGNPWYSHAYDPETASEPAPIVYQVLYVHLFFAVTTTLLWIYVTVQALRKFDKIPTPNAYSATHIFWARLAAWDMVLTGITGCTFYYLAFVA